MQPRWFYLPGTIASLAAQGINAMESRARLVDVNNLSAVLLDRQVVETDRSAEDSALVGGAHSSV